MTEQARAAAAFEVVITPRRKPTEALPLDNFDGSGAQFLRFFAGYVNSFPERGPASSRKGSQALGSPYALNVLQDQPIPVT